MSTIIKRLLIALPLIFIGWLSVIALVMRFSDAAPGAVVILPDAGFMAALPEDAAILSANSFSVTLTSDSPDFARRLYASGARLVLPAGLIGCLPLNP